MGQFTDDKNNDEFMGASAEEWSKPSTPSQPPAQPESTDRWGSPVPEQGPAQDASRWGSESAPPPPASMPEKKGGSKWWIILIVVLVVLCLCACLVLLGLPVLGLSLFPTDFLQF